MKTSSVHRERAYRDRSSNLFKEKELTKIIERVAIASVPFFCLYAPIGRFFGACVETLIAKDHLSKISQNPSLESLKTVQAALCVISCAFKSRVANLASIVLETGLSIYEFKQLSTSREKIQEAINILSNLSFLFALFKNSAPFFFISTFLDASISLIRAEKEYRIKNHWIEPIASAIFFSIRVPRPSEYF